MLGISCPGENPLERSICHQYILFVIVVQSQSYFTIQSQDWLRINL